MAAAFPRRAPAPAAHGARARSIVIIEDNDDTRHMLNEALTLSGHSVREARDGASGIALVGLIALTGYGQAEDQQRAFDAGFDAHLTKPVAPERLKQVMAGLSS